MGNASTQESKRSKRIHFSHLSNWMYDYPQAANIPFQVVLFSKYEEESQINFQILKNLKSIRTQEFKDEYVTRNLINMNENNSMLTYSKIINESKIKKIFPNDIIQILIGYIGKNTTLNAKNVDSFNP